MFLINAEILNRFGNIAKEYVDCSISHIIFCVILTSFQLRWLIAIAFKSRKATVHFSKTANKPASDVIIVAVYNTSQSQLDIIIPNSSISPLAC